MTSTSYLPLSDRPVRAEFVRDGPPGRSGPAQATASANQPGQLVRVKRARQFLVLFRISLRGKQRGPPETVPRRGGGN